MEYLRCGVIEYLDKPMYPSKASFRWIHLMGRYDDES
jgi:hypothetical protein